MNPFRRAAEAATRLYLGGAVLVSLAIALPLTLAFLVTIAPVVCYRDYQTRRGSRLRRDRRAAGLAVITEGRV